MNPVLEVLLTIAAIGGIFVGPTYAMVHQWKLKHPPQAATAAPVQPASEETPAPAPAQPVAVSPAPRPTAPVASPVKPAAPPRPAAPAAIDLRGQFMTFTNLQGKSFDNVRLVKADPRGGLIYSFDGGVGSVPFNTLPLDLLEQLGVPTNWPGVMQGRAVAAAPKPAPVRYAIGDKVEVQWGGKWEPADVKGFDGFNIIVRFSDPNTFFKNDMHVPASWVRHAQ
jgi:hypothetical protein